MNGYGKRLSLKKSAVPSIYPPTPEVTKNVVPVPVVCSNHEDLTAPADIDSPALLDEVSVCVIDDSKEIVDNVLSSTCTKFMPSNISSVKNADVNTAEANSKADNDSTAKMFKRKQNELLQQYETRLQQFENKIEKINLENQRTAQLLQVSSIETLAKIEKAMICLQTTVESTLILQKSLVTLVQGNAGLMRQPNERQGTGSALNESKDDEDYDISPKSSKSLTMKTNVDPPLSNSRMMKSDDAEPATSHEMDINIPTSTETDDFVRTNSVVVKTEIVECVDSFKQLNGTRIADDETQSQATMDDVQNNIGIGADANDFHQSDIENQNMMIEDPRENDLHISDTVVKWGSENRAVKTCPEGIIIKASKSENGEMSAWTTKFFPQNTVFGPFEGLVVANSYSMPIQEHNLLRKVFFNERVVCSVDASEVKRSNWLRYANFARSADEYNLISIFVGAEIFYKAVKDIEEDSELLVWHDHRDIALSSDHSVLEILNTEKYNSGYEAKADDYKAINDDKKSTTLSARNKSSNQNFKPAFDFACQYCKKGFTKHSDTLIHERTHTGEKPHQCPSCSKAFSQTRSLKRHLYQVHNTRLSRTHPSEKPYPCSLCLSSFSQRRSLKRHLCKVHDLDPFAVIEELSKSGLLSRKRHARAAKRDDGKLISLKESKHKNDENCPQNQSIQVQMSVCQSSKNSQISESTQLQDNHAKPSDKNESLESSEATAFKCSKCSEKFIRFTDLLEHQKKHSSPLVKFECQYCKKKFINRRYWVDHEQAHIGIKPYQCPLCSVAYPQVGPLNDHLLKVHYIDVVASKKNSILGGSMETFFVTTIDVRKIDDSENPVKGSKSSENNFKPTSSQSSIGKNIEAAETQQNNLELQQSPGLTEDAKYKCMECATKCTTLADFQRHMKNHTQFVRVQMNKCKYCSKFFRNAFNLRIHERRHRGERPFKCPKCPLIFVQKLSLKDHVLNVHRTFLTPQGLMIRFLATKSCNQAKHKQSKVTKKKISKS